jgi:hypothetical protein
MKAKKMIPLTLGSLFGLLIILGLMGTAGVATWEYTNSDAFCTNACHNVHPENAFAHKASQHAEVACVECHVGRISTFPKMIRKTGHMSHLWAVIFGYERPLTAPSMPPTRESCESCHTTTPHPHNSIRVKRHFASNERNTETKLILGVRTVGRIFHGGQGKGIDEHTRTIVRFIATDPLKQNIPWVEATRPDGTVVVYEDTDARLDQIQIDGAQKHTMECKDCHNLAGHPVKDPDQLIDEALADGTLDPRFPYVKARAVELLSKEFKNADEARELVREAMADYAEEFPELMEKYPEAWESSEDLLEEQQEMMASLLLRNQFDAADISWRSFPDNAGHRNSPGCFRCHNGRHQTSEGNLLPVGCTQCHGIPIVTTRDRVGGELMDLTDMRAPRSHAAQDFIFVHDELADEENAGCDTCHGKIAFGTNNRTFCANSGCHDSSWPGFGRTKSQTTM